MTQFFLQSLSSCDLVREPISVDVKRTAQNHLELNYIVKKKGAYIFDESLSTNDPRKNWGLWNTDVVECFVGSSPSAPYLEFQGGAYGQGFQLEVISARKILYSPLQCYLGLETVHQEESWFTKMMISLPWSVSNSLYLGLFACLHDAQTRKVSYYALSTQFINDQGHIDFHMPQHFIRLQE